MFTLFVEGWKALEGLGGGSQPSGGPIRRWEGKPWKRLEGLRSGMKTAAPFRLSLSESSLL
jgi:hypothetical protein